MTPEEAVEIYARIYHAVRDRTSPPFISASGEGVVAIFTAYMQYLGQRSLAQQIQDELEGGAEEAPDDVR